LKKRELVEKIYLGRGRHMWENNIKIKLTERVYDRVDCVHVAVDKDQWQALLKIVINLGFSGSRRIS
jgi:hypothetical protein